MDTLDAAKIKADFPILSQVVKGKPLVYLDNAATTQKPTRVIEAIRSFYEENNANVHRAIHDLGARATELYEGARAVIARFIGAREPAEIIFTRNATEAINLVAYAWGRRVIQPGDEIITTPMEHHSNLVPWQQLAAANGAKLLFIGMRDDGSLDMDSFSSLLSGRTRLVAVTQASNVLGTINPIKEICDAAHRCGALVLVDGAQSVPHMAVDVTDLGCDFLAFSGHKMLGPTGIGVLYGRREILESMDPFLFGGDMISYVHLESAGWNEVPYKFEAGTPHIAGAVGLAAAVEYLQGIGMERVEEHERHLANLTIERLEALGYVEIYGPRCERAGLVSFNIRGVHPHDVATVLNEEGVAVRAGHHCAQPLMEWLGVPATNRASFYIYNDKNDVERLVQAVMRTKEFFAHAVV